MATESIQRIWKVASLIPAGRVASYGQVADLAGLPGRARLTSKALGQAPRSLNLPWHRILRSSGQIAFAKGSTHADEQQTRLRREGITINNLRVPMKEFQWQPEMATLVVELDF